MAGPAKDFAGNRGKAIRRHGEDSIMLEMAGQAKQ
jgi:hypothetical protein